MLKQLPVHMLWVSGEFSRLARLSLASFVSQGYRVKLWSYDPDHLRGEFAEVLDASLPVPSTMLLRLLLPPPICILPIK